MRRPLMSGHCNFPATHLSGGRPAGQHSHERCQAMGAGTKANPDKEWQPCPCGCHLDSTEYVCENCGRPLRQAPMWPNEDEPGEPVFVHVEVSTGRAIGEVC